MKQYLAIDIGGTAIKYGIIDDERGISEKHEMPTEAEKGGPSILDKILDIVGSYAEQIAGVGISTAGMVDCGKGEIFYASPLIPNYIGINYKTAIWDKYHLPCEVENDVNCAGLAEALCGAAKGAHSAVVITVGTGIGGCLIANGKVYHGFSNSACEIGYMYVNGDVRYERQGATSVMTENVAAAKNEPKENWNGRKIFAAAKNGDSICIEAIEQMADVLCRGIANICYVVNPEVVVLGGGIMAQTQYLAKPLNDALDKYLVPSVRQHTRLAFASLGNDAGMLGAWYNFKQRN